ncbi:acyl-CoA dehydrogenase family protein [Aeromicrobium sp.]|uniref:acyl-CoA dehydrogenase family protein n=1 Tax=Aeromicrobium sp. TaxID=1871063 RepID=UPI0019A2DE18|nr:acyl-CoA dehydrogenase family protein [Aeromicrobium sp.]MBC7631457.1 acyl-CoA dehydrogenase family protein [Aeromicrobium sp.]
MMELADKQELADLRATVNELCGDAGDLAPARAMETAGVDHDPELWDMLGRQMGLACLGLPEQVGGLGGLAEIVTVSGALGATLAPVPFWSSTVLAGQILAALDPLPVDVLTELAEGEVGAAVVADPDGRWDPDRVPVHAHADGDGWRVTGRSHFVAGAGSAQHLVVAAQGTDGVDLFLVSPNDPAVTVLPQLSLDFTRPLASVELSGAATRRLSFGGAGAIAVQRGVDVALIALAAEQATGAQRCLDMTVSYAKLRHQFSRSIGSFQAVKHRLVDLLVQVEFAHSAVDRALASDNDPAAFSEAAAVAAAWCADAYRDVCAETIQLHGGIGFTWEHDAHLFFRRAHADAVLLGDGAFHRERIASLLSW